MSFSLGKVGIGRHSALVHTGSTAHSLISYNRRSYASTNGHLPSGMSSCINRALQSFVTRPKGLSAGCHLLLSQRIIWTRIFKPRESMDRGPAIETLQELAKSQSSLKRFTTTLSLSSSLARSTSGPRVVLKILGGAPALGTTPIHTRRWSNRS